MLLISQLNADLELLFYVKALQDMYLNGFSIKAHN